jgi:hypothetical protein
MTMVPTSVVAVMAWADEELCRMMTVALPTCALAATWRRRRRSAPGSYR